MEPSLAKRRNLVQASKLTSNDYVLPRDNLHKATASANVRRHQRCPAMVINVNAEEWLVLIALFVRRADVMLIVFVEKYLLPCVSVAKPLWRARNGVGAVCDTPHVLAVELAIEELRKRLVAHAGRLEEVGRADVEPFDQQLQCRNCRHGRTERMAGDENRVSPGHATNLRQFLNDCGVDFVPHGMEAMLCLTTGTHIAHRVVGHLDVLDEIRKVFTSTHRDHTTILERPRTCVRAQPRDISEIGMTFEEFSISDEAH